MVTLKIVRAPFAVDNDLFYDVAIAITALFFICFSDNDSFIFERIFRGTHGKC